MKTQPQHLKKVQTGLVLIKTDILIGILIIKLELILL
jgi:hypothetical protein